MNPAPKPRPSLLSRLIQPMIFLILVLLLVADYHGWLSLIKDALTEPSFTYNFGKTSISVYEVLQGLLLIAVIFWIANRLVRFLDRRIGRLKKLHPSSRALIQKIAMISTYVIAFLVGLSTLGINLSSFAVVGGAVGIGLGFGLQKIASNFISGLILLIERTIKMGDLIEVSNGTLGFVRKIAARYTLIETFEGREIMVPNEEFITSRVISWTYSNRKGQIKLLLSVSYESDLERAHNIIIDAAKNHEKVLKDPAPVCFLTEFGESAAHFALMCWVDEIQDNASSTKHDILFTIWKDFKTAGIKIPYPQREIFIRPETPITNVPS